MAAVEPVTNAPATSPPTSLGVRAVRGTAWTALRLVAEYVMRFGSNLILTRLLFPEAFGLMALVSTVMTGLAMFSDIGLAPAVISSPRGDDPHFLRSAWTLQALRGVVLGAAVVALAVPMAHFYGIPELREIMPVTALTVMIGGCNSIALFRMQRHLELGRLATLELLAQAISIAVTVVWARAFPSVWALVGGGVVGSLVKLALSHALGHGGVFGIEWERKAVREVVHFGKWIFLSTVFAFFANQADRLLFGKVFSVEMLGVYGIALVVGGLPTQLLWSIGNYVILPTFSRQAATSDALDRSYRTLQLPLLLIGGLPVALLLACGPVLIKLLYDARYSDAGWMLQLVAVGVWFQVPQTLSANALMAVGHPRSVAIANGVKLVGMIALVPLGYVLGNARGAILALALAESFRWMSLAFATARHRLPGWRTDLACVVPVVAQASAGALASTWLRKGGGGAAFALMGGSSVVLALWLATSLVLLRDRIPALWQRLRDAR